MSHEQTNPNQYRGPFGPAELQSYPTSTGDLQLAETYTEPNTDVIWDNHPATTNNDPQTAAERRAIISDASNNLYYLQGNTMYDITGSAREGRLILATYDDATKLPDLTIGKPLYGQSPVTRVQIAGEQVPTSDPRANDAAHQQSNPFEAMAATIKQMQQSSKRSQRQAAPPVNAPITAGATFPERDFRPSSDFRKHANIPGAVTNLTGIWKHLDNTLPRETSRHGVPISPRENVAPPSYTIDPALGEDAVRQHIAETDQKTVAKVTAARNRQYVPTAAEETKKALKDFSKDAVTAAGGLFRRKKRPRRS